MEILYSEKQKEHFRRRFRELSQAKGKIKEKLAKEMGYSRYAIGYWLSGKSMPKEASLLDICSYFGVSKKAFYRARWDGRIVAVGLVDWKGEDHEKG